MTKETLNSQRERIAFVPTEEQMVRYRLLRKRLVDEPGLVNISEEMRTKLDEILDRLNITKDGLIDDEGGIWEKP